MKTPRSDLIQKYLQADVFCPWCESTKIEVVCDDGDVGIHWTEVTCNNCNARWRDEFALNSISWENDEETERVYSDELAEAERTKAVERMEQMISMVGFGSDVLDGHVHELLSSKASEINNQGAKVQLDFILKEMGTEAGVEWISDIFDDMINDPHNRKENS